MIVSYNGLDIDSEYFRAYVYHSDGRQRLANSWEEHQNLLDSGEWFSSKVTELPTPSRTKPSVRKRK